MGQRGPQPKTTGPRAERRARAAARAAREGATVVSLVPAPPPVLAIPGVPETPANLRPSTLLAWETFWDSDVADQIIRPEQHQVVLRLFSYYDQHERAMEIVNTAMAVKGSKGQIRVNPLAGYALSLAKVILQLEMVLGLTPMSRAQIGLTNAAGALTVERINQMALNVDQAPAIEAATPDDLLRDKWEAAP